MKKSGAGVAQVDSSSDGNAGVVSPRQPPLISSPLPQPPTPLAGQGRLLEEKNDRISKEKQKFFRLSAFNADHNKLKRVGGGEKSKCSQDVSPRLTRGNANQKQQTMPGKKVVPPMSSSSSSSGASDSDSSDDSSDSTDDDDEDDAEEEQRAKGNGQGGEEEEEVDGNSSSASSNTSTSDEDDDDDDEEEEDDDGDDGHENRRAVVVGTGDSGGGGGVTGSGAGNSPKPRGPFSCEDRKSVV